MEYLLDKELYAKCILEIQKLPQYNSLLPDDIDLWLDTTYRNDPTRIMWHIKRLNGFGGSEIGHLVAEDFEEFDQFGSPRDTVAAKLMLRMPDGPSGDTARGTFMEDTIRDMFRAEMNAVPLDDVMDMMQSYRSEDHPWLVGNTDDYLRIGDKCYVVDYKCPRPGFEDKYDKYGVKFDYIAQLHHYALIIKDLGHPVDGLILCSFDMVGWKNDVRVVDINPKMYDAILNRGDQYWFDYIMAGELPPYVEYAKGVDVKDSLIPADKQQHVANMLAELAGLAPLASAAYARAAEIKEEVTEILNTVYLGAPKLVSGIIDISVKPSIDEEKVADVAAAVNLNLDEFKLIEKPNYEAAWTELARLREADKKDMSEYIQKEIDYDAVEKALIDLKEPEHKFKKESFTIAVTRTKKPAIKAKVDKVKELSKLSLITHLKNITDLQPEVPALPEVDELEIKPVKPVKQSKAPKVDPLAAKTVVAESAPLKTTETATAQVGVVAETPVKNEMSLKTETKAADTPKVETAQEQEPQDTKRTARLRF